MRNTGFKLFGLLSFFILLISCGETIVDDSNDGEINVNDDYYEFQDFDLQGHDIPAVISSA